MKMIINIVFILSLLLYSENYAQNRRETDILRKTDTSRRSEEPNQQEHKRPVDESGKLREVPRSDPPQRDPQRWIDNSRPVMTYREHYYISEYESPDYSVSADIYIPEPIIIYTSEKEEAMDLMKNESYDSAIKLLTASIEKNSKDLELYFLRGIAEIRAEYYKNAIEDLDYYLEFFEKDGEGYFMRGLAKFLDLDKQEAQKDFIIATDLKCAKAKQILKKYY